MIAFYEKLPYSVIKEPTKKVVNKLSYKRNTKKMNRKRLFTILGLLVFTIFACVVAAFIREAYLDLTAPEPAYKTKEQAFINKLSTHAQEIQKNEHILTSVTLAQAILESNWGESGLAKQANNLFGVKGKGNQKVINLTTKEYKNGKWIEIKANFRKYDSWNEALDEHAKLFKNGTSWNAKKYDQVIAAKDYKTAAQALQKSGYATDPTYAVKLVDIIERYGLDIYDHISDRVISNKKMSTYASVKKNASGIVWSVPYGLIGAQKVEHIQFYARDDLEIVRQAKTTSGTWYQFGVDDKTIGWVKANLIKLD